MQKLATLNESGEAIGPPHEVIGTPCRGHVARRHPDVCLDLPLCHRTHRSARHPRWCAVLLGLFTTYWIGRKIGGLT